MKIILTMLLMFLSLSAYKIKNADGDIVLFIDGDNNDRISINCGDDALTEDYALKVCGKILAKDFVKDSVSLDFKDSDDSLEGDETDDDHKIKVTLELNKKTDKDVTFHFETKEDVAKDGEDYDGIDDDFTIAAGDTSVDIEINIKGDNDEEDDEKFAFEITNVKNADLVDATGDYTINNDDSKPKLNIDDGQDGTDEDGTDNKTTEIWVKLTEKLGSDVTFKYKTVEDTAKGGDDFTAVSDKKATIKAGDDAVKLEIEIVSDDDGFYEAKYDKEKFQVQIYDASSNVDIDDDTGDIYIKEKDTKPVVKLKEDVSEDEGTQADFTVEINKKADVDVTVDIKAANGDDGTDDTADDDFKDEFLSPTKDGRVTISAGETSATVTIKVNDDSDDEKDEDYTVEISIPENATLDDDNKKKTGTIINDDSSGMFSDKRLKTDIREIKTSLQAIEKLNGVKFYWRDKKRFGEQEEVGVIAQDVEKVYPQLVVTGKDGYKKVKYQFLVAPLIEAVKELKKQNEDLRERVKRLENN